MLSRGIYINVGMYGYAKLNAMSEGRIFSGLC